MPLPEGMYAVQIDEVTILTPNRVRVLGRIEGAAVDGAGTIVGVDGSTVAVERIEVDGQTDVGVALVLSGVETSDSLVGRLLLGGPPPPQWWTDAVERFERREGWHRHDALVLQDRKCPACQSPAGELLVYRDNPTGRLFIMCHEMEEGWWHPDDVRPQHDLLPWRDLIDWDLATEQDLTAAGWDASRFALEEKWWTD